MDQSNVPLSKNRNLRFVGSLDSSKTAHPVPSASEIDNWWMSTEQEIHLLHNAAAEVLAIKHVLMGEILQLPRNQSFDSPAWFKLGDHFIKSEIPLFSICVIGKSATPEAFVIDCAEQFEPTSPFALSAWPGLTDDQRKKIAKNIKSQGNFKEMFKDFKIDSQWKATFESQQSVLQRLLEYLEEHYNSEPQLIRAVDYAKTTTWHRIEMDYQNPQFVEEMRIAYGEDLASNLRSVFEEIKTKAYRDFDEPKQIMRWLNSRTNLYKEIYQQQHQLREILRAEIDRCYVETTSESVTSIGRFSDTDRSDTKRPIDQRFLDSLLVDENNDPAGLREYYIIDFDHSESQQKSIDSFLEILKDEEFSERIKLLRRIRSWPEVSLQRIEEMEQDHVEKLCQELPDLIIQQEQKSFRLIWRTIQFVASFIPILSPVVETGSYVKDILDEIANEQIKDALNKAKLRDREGELILRERKIALAGILRDWLTKEILINKGKPK